MAGPIGTILNITDITTEEAVTESPNNVANLYGMLVHASPGNTVNVLISLGAGETTFTLTPDASIRLDPAQCPNTGQLNAAAADGATASVLEILL